MKKTISKITTVIFAICMLMAQCNLNVFASDAQTTYEIYPQVQDITYDKSSFELNAQMNVVYGEGIDRYTKQRMQEVLAIKGIEASVQSQPDITKQNILVGIHGSNDAADQYMNDKNENEAEHFEKIDANIVSIENGNIVILGKDSDAAYHGITTLKHIFNQVQDRTIECLMIKDYADVATRGFIEGYYGDPWSVQDRMDLMKYGGDYKLNGYMYAPKDDPYHNAKWRTLYDDAKLEDIRKLAQAGNESKCYYVYALHTFMSNPVRFNTEANYQNDLEIIKAKFTQVMNVGVRKFAILADDAHVPAAGEASPIPGNGASNYVRLMNDLTDWMKEKQQEIPDLKTDLLICPNAYMGWGNDDQLRTMNEGLYDSVQIVMTGGAVWGQVSPNFLNTFIKNITTPNKQGRSPFMWINWPCNDNTKWGLIMGGASRFLIPGVDPKLVKGIVLNPMQISEANKSGLFAIADYGWNIWESNADADENWNDSFDYMDHGTAQETDSSLALREISKHMMNSNTGIPESIELAPKLNAFKTAYASGADYIDQANDLIQEFENLKAAAAYYKEHPGTEKTRDQIIYWLECWDDTTTAAIKYLEAAIEYGQDRDPNTLWSLFSVGQAAYTQSKSHPFWYMDHYQYAKIGNQHIVPFIQFMESDLSAKIGPLIDPSIQITTFISNRSDSPLGDKANVFDNDDNTSIEFRTPAAIAKDDYIGVSYTKPIDVNSIRFLMGGGKNHIQTSKLQYTTDGTIWQDVNDEIYTRPAQNGAAKAEITVEGLELKKVVGIRLIATADNTLDAWLNICSIDINKAKDTSVKTYPGTASVSSEEGIGIGTRAGSLANITDGNASTSAAFARYPYLTPAEDPKRDHTMVGSYVQLNLGDNAVPLGEISFLQAANDKLDEAILEYSVDGTTWNELATFTDSRTEITFDCNGLDVKAKAIRVRNLKETAKWWEVKEFSAKEPDNSMDVDPSLPMNLELNYTNGWKKYAGNADNLKDGNDNTDIEFDPSTSIQDTSIKGDYIGYDLGKIAYIDTVRIVVGGKRDATNKWREYHLEYSLDNKHWTTYQTYTGKASGKDVIEEKMDHVKARFIRLVNDKNINRWVIFSEFTVTENKSIPSKNNLYTNMDTDILTLSTDSETKLSNLSSSITMNANDYIGVKLNRLKDVSSIQAVYDNENISTQVSSNGKEWKNAKDFKGAARYVRLINNTNEPQTVTIQDLIVTSNEVSPISLLETTMGINPSWGVNEDTRNNGAAFDGNIDSITNFADFPQKGQYIIYDLGQTYDIRSLRYYIQDSAVNYIRDASFSTSMDKTNWDEAFTIGDGEENINDGNINAVNSGLFKTDSTYPNKFYQGNDDLNVKARYLKIAFTASNNNRGVWINEIMVNRGAYVPTVNDPTFVSDPIEERGFEPSNLRDGNLITAYKPNTNNGTIKEGSLTYTISEYTDIKKINIIQNAATISNAEVMIRYGADAWKKIGKLNKSLNEFLIFTEDVFEIKILWKDQAPILQEIITINDFDLPDIKPLQDRYNELAALSGDTYTSTTYAVLTKKLEAAATILNASIMTQEQIDKALEELNAAYTGLTLRANDFTAFDEALADARGRIEQDYTPESWQVLENALMKANDIHANRDAFTQEEVNASSDELNKALNGLQLVIKKDALIQAIDNASTLKENDYTEKSWQVFKAALDAAILVRDNDAATQEEINNALTELNDAQAKLIEDTITSKRILHGAIVKTEQAIKEGQLEKLAPAVVTMIQTRLADAKAVYDKEDATNAQVLDAWMNLAEAMHYLDFKADKALLKVLIEECSKLDMKDYKEGVEDFLKALSNANTVYNNANALQASIDKAYKDLETARDGLVKKDVVNTALLEKLVQRIETTIGDGSKYIKNENWNIFQDALQHAKDMLLKEDVTQAEINAAMSALTDAYENIRLTPDEALLENLRSFIETMQALDANDYKAGDYTRMMNAKAKAEALLKNFNEMEYKAFEKEMAEMLNMAANKKVAAPDKSQSDVNKPSVKPSDKNVNTADASNLLGVGIMLLISGIAMLCIRRRKED